METLTTRTLWWKAVPRPLQPSWERLRSSPIGARLVRGTFWTLASALISRALGLASSVLIARTLGKNAFGELGMVQSTIVMFSTFAGLGMGLTATKHVAEFRAKDPAKAARICGLSSVMAWSSGLLMSLFLVIYAPTLATHTLSAPHLADVVRLAAPLLLLEAVNGVQIGALNGFEAFRIAARINFLSGLASFPLTIIGLLVWGIRGVVLATVATALLRVGLSATALRSESSRCGVALGWSGCLTERSVLWRFALPAVLANVVLAPVIWAGNVLLVNGPAGYAGMATWGAANQWRNLVLFLPNIIMQAVLPVFASSVGEGERSQSFQRTLSLTQSIMVLSALPTCTGLMFLSDWLMRLYWKTSTFESAALIGCVFASLVQCLGAATGPALQAKSKMWLGLAFNASWGATYLAFCVVFVPRLGATALAFGQALAYVLLTIWGFLYMRADLPEGMLKRVFQGLGLACLLAAGCLALPTAWRGWVAVPAAGAAAVAALFLVDASLRRALLGVLKKR